MFDFSGGFLGFFKGNKDKLQDCFLEGGHTVSPISPQVVHHASLIFLPETASLTARQTSLTTVCLLIDFTYTLIFKLI